MTINPMEHNENVDKFTEENIRTALKDIPGIKDFPAQQIHTLARIIKGIECTTEESETLAQCLAIAHLKRKTNNIIQQLEDVLAQYETPYKKLPQTDPVLFQAHNETPVATAPVVLSSIQAIMLKAFEDREGRPIFEKRFSNDRVIQHFITDADPNSENLEALAGKAAWQIVERFGMLTAYIHLIFAAYATESPEPWKDPFTLRGTDLITMLGMDKKRSDLRKAEKLKDIAHHIKDLASFGVCIQSWPEGNKDLSIGMGRMWDIWIDLKGEVFLPGFIASDANKLEKIELTEIILTVRPGLWTSKFLNKTGASNKEALRQFGYLAKSTLQFDLGREELAARLAVYLTVMSKINEAGTHKVGTLLAAVLPIDIMAATHKDSRKRYDLKQKWDNSLVSLETRGWHVQSSFDETGYNKRMPANYWSKLLDSTVTITPPDPIPALLATGKEKSSRKQHRKTRSTPTLTGNEIRQARETLGLTQRALAQKLGISQALISRVESSGDRTLQPEQQAALKRILHIEK